MPTKRATCHEFSSTTSQSTVRIVARYRHGKRHAWHRQSSRSHADPVTGTATGPARSDASSFLLDLYGTAVGKKYVMAITGIIVIGFVVAHMIGNLKMYLGPEDFNHYGEFLRELLVPHPAAHGRAVAAADRPDRRRRAAHPRRLQPDRAQPRAPAR